MEEKKKSAISEVPPTDQVLQAVKTGLCIVYRGNKIRLRSRYSKNI